MRLLVLVAAMIPAPGESAEEMFANTGYERVEQSGSSDLDTFYHDVAPKLAAEALSKGRRQSQTPSKEPWPRPHGQTFRHDSCYVATTASFLRRGSVASCENVSRLSPTKSTAVTRPHSAIHASWSCGLRPTELSGELWKSKSIGGDAAAS